MNAIVKVILSIVVVILLIASGYYAYITLVKDANEAPDEPQLIVPVLNDDTVDLEPLLQWDCTDPDNDTLTYDVFFGDQSPPSKVSSNQSSTSYSPDTLAFTTTYYWKIIAWDDDNASSASELWEFTTRGNLPPESPSSPNPSDGATGMSITKNLQWTGGDPDPNDEITYDVYFGISSSPALVSSQQADTLYNPGVLNYSTTYYWKIIAQDAQEVSTEGSLWEFTTKEEPDENPEETTRTVFVEEGTAGWCTNCPAVATTLHDLFEAGELDFYYVSLVQDKNEKAKQRLEDDYNIVGFPTVFIDGGYEVKVGGEDLDEIEEKISAAANRDAPMLDLSIEAVWDDVTETFDTMVTIENKESTTYDGTLKVYLTEKRSSWFDYQGVPFSFAFLDYVIDTEISLAAGQNSIETYDGYDIGGRDPANIKLIAVIFNSEPVEQDSSPNDNPYLFDAYYADATTATDLVEEGNLPPEIGISNPKQLRWHFRGKPIFFSPLYRNTVLIGKTNITVYAQDDSAITKVTLSIDGEEVDEITTPPYEFTFRKIKYLKRVVRRHTFTVTAYDNEGKSTSASIECLCFFI